MQNDEASVYYELDLYPTEDYRTGNFIHRTYRSYTSREQFVRGSGYYMNCMTVTFSSGDIGTFKFGVDYAPPGYSLNGYQDIISMIFVIDGAGTINGIPFRRGDFYYICPMEPNVSVADSSEPWQTVWLQVSGRYQAVLQRQLKAISEQPFLRFHAPDQVRRLAEFLIYEQDCNANPAKYVQSVLSLLLSYVYSPEEGDDARNNAPRKVRLMQEACDTVRRDLATVTVAGLAQKFHFEEKYFSRIFREVIGMTPQSYILSCKLEWVDYFLTETDMSMAQIMDSVGYRHRNGLIAVFRKKYGCTPSEWRKRHGKTKNPR